jgi:hypothetical protein
MKKILFTLLVFMTAYGAFAQFINKGAMMIGGTVGFSSETDKDKTGSVTVTNGTTTSFYLAPQFGYFIIDNFALGADIQLSTGKYTPDNNSNTSSNSTAIEFRPFVRYYLDMGIFFQGQFGVGSETFKTQTGNLSTEAKYGLTSWSLAAGYAAFLNDNVAIEPMLGYGNTVSTRKNSDPVRKEINPELFLRIGLQVYLRKK